ncbi:MAG: RHS repeat-associated core domain-containing protein [Kiritimatiellae bacterium]|nr:RHS repeat-associated core domain-containing protein [Kiritimatiellia bacterium]
MIPITMRCSCVNALFFPPPALPVGRRVWRTFRRHDFTYDGWNLIHETVTETAGAATNVTERQYFWGPDLSGSLQGAGGVGGLLAVSVGGRFHFPCHDANGNVTKYLDESGNAVAAYTYGDFGETLERSGPMADVFPHRFSTKYLDAETELYYYGYRFYNPALKRWMSRDPIGEEGGVNLYGFCGNNGISLIDLFGKMRMYTVNCSPLVSGVNKMDSFWLAVCATFSGEEHNVLKKIGGWITYTKAISINTNMRNETSMIYSTLEVFPFSVKTVAQWDMDAAYDERTGIWAPAYFVVANLKQLPHEKGTISISVKWQLSFGSSQPNIITITDPLWNDKDLSGSNDNEHHITFSPGWAAIADEVASSAGISLFFKFCDGEYNVMTSVRGDWVQSPINRRKESGMIRRGMSINIPGSF